MTKSRMNRAPYLNCDEKPEVLIMKFTLFSSDQEAELSNDSLFLGIVSPMEFCKFMLKDMIKATWMFDKVQK
jgi:hypothetical protein